MFMHQNLRIRRSRRPAHQEKHGQAIRDQAHHPEGRSPELSHEPSQLRSVGARGSKGEAQPAQAHRVRVLKAVGNRHAKGGDRTAPGAVGARLVIKGAVRPSQRRVRIPSPGAGWAYRRVRWGQRDDHRGVAARVPRQGRCTPPGGNRV